MEAGGGELVTKRSLFPPWLLSTFFPEGAPNLALPISGSSTKFAGEEVPGSEVDALAGALSDSGSGLTSQLVQPQFHFSHPLCQRTSLFLCKALFWSLRERQSKAMDESISPLKQRTSLAVGLEGQEGKMRKLGLRDER